MFPSLNSITILDHVKGALETDPYDSPEWGIDAQPSFRNRIEGGYGAGRPHNIVHAWVGGIIIDNDEIVDWGDMAYGGSHNDPACFFGFTTAILIDYGLIGNYIQLIGI